MLVRFFCLAWLCLGCVYPVLAAVELSEKHLIILRAGIDSIWGDYIFSVQNSQQKPQHADITLFLPQETVDFKAVEGVTADDLRVDIAHGTVVMQKEFAHGASLVNVGFKVPAHGGVATLNWTARQALASVNVMYEHDIIEVSSNKLVVTQLPRIADIKYRALHTQQALAMGDSLQLRVSGIPQGRGRVHLFAVVFAAILLISTVYWGFRSRPRHTDEGS